MIKWYKLKINKDEVDSSTCLIWVKSENVFEVFDIGLGVDLVLPSSILENSIWSNQERFKSVFIFVTTNEYNNWAWPWIYDDMCVCK
jgi:hypothetical protein